jgi:hypothetical protein
MWIGKSMDYLDCSRRRLHRPRVERLPLELTSLECERQLLIARKCVLLRTIAASAAHGASKTPAIVRCDHPLQRLGFSQNGDAPCGVPRT